MPPLDSLFVALACAGAITACGGEEASDDGGTDGAVDAHKDAGVLDVGPIDAGPALDAACLPDLPSGYTPTWIPPLAPSSACTSTQIQSLYDACHGPNQSVSACSAFTAANAPCVACMQTPIASNSYGATIVWHGGAALEANVGGCMALIDGDLSASGCGAKFEAWDSCVIAACSYCVLGTFEGCAVPARTGDCGAYKSAADQCAGDPQYSACTSQPTFEAYFTTFGAMFCGAGAAADASTD